MNNIEENTTEKEENTITPQKYYTDKIRFIEKHWAFLSSLLFALVVFSNYILKAFEFSKAEAMYIDRSWIEFDSQYVIYTFMKSFLFIFIFAVYNYIVYYVLTKFGKNKIISSVILMILLYFLTVLIMFGIFLAAFKTNPFELFVDDKIEFAAFIIATLIAGFFMTFLGLFFSFEKLIKPSKNKKIESIRIEVRNVILAFLAIFIVLFSYLYSINLGAAAVAAEKEFKIYDNYVVLAEDRNKILCSKIEKDDIIDGQRILVFDCKNQFVFSVDTGISTSVQTYDKVYSNSKTFTEFVIGGFS